MLSELHWENLPIHIVNMIILFVIVRFLVYKPLRRFMDARSERIAASLERAKRADEEAAAFHAQAGMILAEAEERARIKALEITGAADEAARATAESAEARSRALLEKARADIREEHDRAMAGLRDEVVDLAAEMAAQILRQSEGGDAP